MVTPCFVIVHSARLRAPTCRTEWTKTCVLGQCHALILDLVTAGVVHRDVKCENVFKVEACPRRNYSALLIESLLPLRLWSGDLPQVYDTRASSRRPIPSTWRIVRTSWVISALLRA